MPYVQIPVPEEHVPAVYALLVRLQSGGEETGLMPEAAAEPTEELVKGWYGESHPNHQALMELLAADAGRWVGSAELIKVLHLAHGSKSLAGLLGSFGRRANHRYGGARLWDAHWDHERGEVVYRMSEPVAKWVREAAD